MTEYPEPMQELASSLPSHPQAAPPAADGLVDWNALGVRLMPSSRDRADPADAQDDAQWEAFPTVYPNGPTLH